jgi:hypothetical protein
MTNRRAWAKSGFTWWFGPLFFGPHLVVRAVGVVWDVVAYALGGVFSGALVEPVAFKIGEHGAMSLDRVAPHYSWMEFVFAVP